MSVAGRIALGLVALAVVGCAGTPPGEVSPSPDGSPSVTPEPAASPSPTPEPTASPSPAPTDGGVSPSPSEPTPSPAVRPSPTFSPTLAPGGTTWSGPDRISERGYYEPSMVMTGGLTDIAHVAAGLGGGIFYVTNDQGNMAGSWTRERLSSPPRRNSDEQPSIARDETSGDMYIAFTRLYDSELGRFPEGIYLLRRPYGMDWSAPTLLVGEGAHSPSLQAHDGRIYLAYVAGSPSDVIDDDPHFPVMYGTDRSGTFAAAEVFRNGARPQLELGFDGRPRILFGSPFWAEVGVQYAVGSTPSGSFTVERLPGTTGDERRPSLALDAADRPHAAWNLWPEDAREPAVYYARRGGSGWTSPQRLLENVLAASIVVDHSGAAHVVAGGEDGVWYVTDTSGSFRTQRLSREQALWLDLVPPEEGIPRQVHLIFVSGEDSRGDGLWYGVGQVD